MREREREREKEERERERERESKIKCAIGKEKNKLAYTKEKINHEKKILNIQGGHSNLLKK